MEQQMMAEESLHALADIRDIRSMMERSTRFLSLSGWSGVWAGCTALVSAGIAWQMHLPYFFYRDVRPARWEGVAPFVLLGAATFLVALVGAYYFTWRKASASGQKMWTRPARELMTQVAIPIIIGGIFCLSFLYEGLYTYLAPACLAFYGLALINGSKYTLTEIRWLGYCELLLGCIALFVPYYGLAFLAAGFGLLHIIYGIVMWNKYG